MKQKPLLIRGFGIYCSKSTIYNPKIIEVLYQKKNSNKYISLGNFKLSLSIGTQLLTTEETIFSDIEKIKFIIKETYGGNKVCINNIYLYEYLPSVDFTMSYQNMEINTEENINNTNNQNILGNISKTLNLGELNMNNITKEIINTNNNNIVIQNNENKIEEKIFSNNLPTRTSEILISESDLTDKKPINKRNNFFLEIKNNNVINKKKSGVNKTNKKENKIYIKEEEEKQNPNYTSFNEDLLQKNIAVHSKPKDIFNNSNIIFTTTEAKNFTTENNINENILNTISNLSNINNIHVNDKFNSFKMNVKNKINEYDVRISNVENEIINLKKLMNDILNNMNQLILQNKSLAEKEYKNIVTECKNYIDNKMVNICETLNNNQKNYYYDTQPHIYNQSYSINSNVIHPNLYNGTDIFCNNEKNISTENVSYKNNNTNTNANVNINMKVANNFRNKMNLSKIMKKNFKKPQLTQQIVSTNINSKKNFNSLKREKSLDVLTIKKNLLLNKNIIKKNPNQSKKSKKEKEADIDKILSKKLNKKLNNINEEIEDKIYKSILKPTLRELEKNLQNNFETIKEKLRSHSVNYSHPETKHTKSNRLENNNKIEIQKDKNEEENISIETENIKKNIVEKQHQLNELLFKLNNKQNQSLNYYISFRKDK